MMRRALVLFYISLASLLAGCTTAPAGSTRAETESYSSEAESLNQAQQAMHCYSVRSLSLSADRLRIKCRNPKGVESGYIDVAAESPVPISTVLDLVAIKMRYNQLPDESPDLVDTINETRDLMSLKFSDNRVTVMVLDFIFDEQSANSLQEINARFEVLGEKPILPE